MTGHLVGRVGELACIDAALAELDLGRPGAIALVGEPGIGKTRLLKELAARAEALGHLVLSGSASELERNLPYSVFIDALDEYLGSLEPERLAVLGDNVQAELAYVFPSVAAPAVEREVALQHERYRSHRAVRDLLMRLAAPRPLVLMLDDFHWADAGSVELLGALLRRPPAAAVLIALAVRPHPLAERLVAALERAQRGDVLTRIEICAFSLAEVGEFLGEAVDTAEAAALYEECGGNPFYLQQLARAPGRAAGSASVVAEMSLAIGVPTAVAAALTEELALLSDSARLVFEGAAVAGDPFEPELAAAAAATS
jgi:predicted ATPase